ncbi:MAG TPA: long-chain-fatty-acid--CoA ligase [Saprospiraceae bacterium]|nr:long-chain-fatty-acid--CoA ligase [Saprospiraceae bacterium]
MSDSRFWLKNFPPGVPANIDSSQYENLVELINESLKKYGPKPAFTCMGKSISYTQLDKDSANFGAYLQSRGLVPGDKIAIMMPNLLQYPIALFGALRAGLTVVNTNPLYTPREMLHQFTDSEVKAIIILNNFASNLEKILGETNIQTIITTSIGELLGFAKGKVVNFVVKNVKGMVPKYTLPNPVSFSEAIKQGKKFSIQPFDNPREQVIIHQYTGGTTGVSKGAMLTNHNLISTMLQIKAVVAPFLPKDNVVGLCPLPLYHVFAFAVNGLALFSLGANNILVTNPRDIKSLVKEFKGNKIQLMTGVNTLFNALLHNKKFRAMDTSNLNITIGGGMAVQTPVAIEWEKVTGCYLAQGYGLTETCAIVSVNPFTKETGKLGTIGLPFPSTDIRIVDKEGHQLGLNTPGEILVKGPQVMKGYYKRPDETAKTIKDGWLYTGDIGQMDEDGFLKIVDRKKDMILVSGFNVFPNEVEDVLVAHPKILEIGAIGVPDEHSGEVVKVFVVKKDKSLTKKEILAFAKENLTGYKRPKVIEFVDELPKSNVGKILRRKLREL